jgi:hypothetical protein
MALRLLLALQLLAPATLRTLATSASIGPDRGSGDDRGGSFATMDASISLGAPRFPIDRQTTIRVTSAPGTETRGKLRGFN